MLWQLRDRALDPHRQPLVMGIVNVTPDSFSDGGRYFDAARAVEHALRLVQDGADMLDIGGESSRPGANPVSLDEELNRVLPVVEQLVAQTHVPLSIDTTKAAVADAALAAGAHVINDVTALTADPAMADVVRRHNAGLVLMHMQGTPQTMQINPTYGDVVEEVANYLQARLQAAEDLGIAGSRVVIDPGVGFGKTHEHNLRLIARLAELGKVGRPVCLGVSRKGFLGQITGRNRQERLASSLAVACHALADESAQIFRVHDAAATRDAVRVFLALRAEES